jgi:multidrug efflux pump subunit AcrA (membrane-fusion protein)
MNTMTRTTAMLASVLITSLVLTGCNDDTPATGTLIDTEASAALPSNHIAIPPAVRGNLGITFAPTERRQIEETLRAPGRFEYLPTASRQYRTILPGRVEILVDQFEHVEVGTPLYTLDSPQWRKIQQSIAESESAVAQLQTTLDTYNPLLRAHERHEKSIGESISIWSARVKKFDALREAGGGRMSDFTAARSALATGQTDLARVQEQTAEINAAHAQTISAIAAGKTKLALVIDAAASLLGIDRSTLLAPSSTAKNAAPLWRSITSIQINAHKPGIVESIGLTNGAWADERVNVVTVVQPDKLRFHASGLQSDLGVLRDGLAVTIVPPTPTASGTAIPMQQVMQGTLSLGLTGDSNKRTIDLYVTPKHLTDWAMPGVTAQLEIVTDTTGSADLAIPLAAVQRDGLTPVIFRRNPNNPNEAIRMEADLGVDDGRWVAVLSGLRDGDEVILDGGFQLMLATSGSIQKGGHFHSDGTFHDGEH